VRADEPGKVAVKTDRASIVDVIRFEPGDTTAKDNASRAQKAASVNELKIDRPAGQKTMARFDEQAAGGDVNEPHFVSRPDADTCHSVLGKRMDSGCGTPLKLRVHRGFQRRECELNLRMRVLPVAPRIRITY
jgi:hypothetical protein